MQAPSQTLVLLGTGGTIAGRGDDVGYRAGQIGVERLADGLDIVSARIEVEQIAQIDSKDLGFDLWLRLAQALQRHLARAEVAGIVVAHGTDTLEESAWFLQRVLAPQKPVVLTGAMRPAGSAQSDGPRNLQDALRVAAEPGARGVVVVFAGSVFGALDVRKVHPFRLAAFGVGEAGPIGVVELGTVRRFRDWPSGQPLGVAALPADPSEWPVVEIVTSHAGARGSGIDALVESGADGIVVATTGNGTVHSALEAALARALACGVDVVRATRCLDGAIIDADPSPAFRSAGAATPVQARIELMLELARRRSVDPACSPGVQAGLG